MPGRNVLHSLFLFTILLSLDIAKAVTYERVQDVKTAMYKTMQYTGGWYKNLNATAAIGSQAPTAGRAATGILMNASDVQWPLTVPRILVCSLTTFEQVMLRIASDSASMGNVMGVLVDRNGAYPAGFSSADVFPGAFNAPYAATSYAWNPSGTGLARRFFNFPVIAMNTYMAAEVAWRTKYNSDQAFNGAVHQADMTMDMLASGNSINCLNQGNCKAIGGFSVWSAMPPMAPLYPNLNRSLMPTGQGALTAPSAMSITVVTAQIDSNSYFHDYTQASDSTLAGLIAMLAAMDILRATGASSSYTRQLVFVAMAGEAWDYMGSRRLLYEMYSNSTAAAGLDLARIDQVIEMGQIGRGYSNVTNSSTLYLHTQSGTSSTGQQYGDASALVAALQAAATQTTEAKMTLTAASSTNPGIPPSSLMSFLRHKPSIQGVVLADFDQRFKNVYYQSELDTGTFVDSEPIAAAAVVLARTLHTLASPGGAPAVPLQVDMALVNDLVLRLAWCLMIDGAAPNYSLLCSTVQSFINVGYTNLNAEGNVAPFPWRYIGINDVDQPDPTNITRKREIFSFLFNLMANTTASVHTSSVCDPYVNFCAAGQVCVGWRSGQDANTSAATMGKCKASTTKFVQALSTRLRWVNALSAPQLLLLAEPTEFNALYGWPGDPLWTESDWTVITPTIRVYMAEPRNVQVAILVAGLLLSLATGVVAYLIQRLFENRLKHD